MGRARTGRAGDGARAASIAATLALVVMLAATAHAAEVEAAEVDGIANVVEVAQGSSATFSIRVTASGPIRCSATPQNPATAQLPSSWSIDAAGGVAAGDLGDAVPFFGVGVGTCSTSWPGDPTPQSVIATVSADLFAPLGERMIRLRPVLFTPGGTGTPLRDDSPTFLRFSVVPGRDAEPPSVTCDGPRGARGAHGWLLSSAEFDCTADDAGSGLADPTDASFALRTSGEGTVTTEARAIRDRAGNETPAGPFGPFTVDLHDPMVSIAWPSDGEQVVLGARRVVDATCADTPDGSGIDRCEIGSIDSSSIGEKSVGVSATDVAGRTTVVTRSYRVVYGGGAPAAVGSVHRAGSTVVVRWSLGGLADPASFRGARSAPADASDPGDAIDVAGSPVRYDASTDRYSINWKTDRAWNGPRRLTIDLADGTSRSLVVDLR